jgi:hypothetical protein
MKPIGLPGLGSHPHKAAGWVLLRQQARLPESRAVRPPITSWNIEMLVGTAQRFVSQDVSDQDRKVTWASSTPLDPQSSESEATMGTH